MSTATMETSDLTQWGENDVQMRLAELPQVFKIRAVEGGWEAGFDSLINDIKSGGDEGGDAFTRLARLKLLVLNLMRAECGLAFTAEPVARWDAEDLKPAPWGNDYETSDNPKNGKGVRGTVSPRPGWWFRMVEANAEVVCKQVRFWDPEGGLLAPERIAMLEKSGHRKRGQEVLKAVLELKPEHFHPADSKKRRK